MTTEDSLRRRSFYFDEDTIALLKEKASAFKKHGGTQDDFIAAAIRHADLDSPQFMADAEPVLEMRRSIRDKRATVKDVINQLQDAAKDLSEDEVRALISQLQSK